jgi:hypothetical protein
MDQEAPLVRESASPAETLMRLINGYQVSQAIHVAATLGVADLLQNGERSCDDLAAACGADPPTLYRLLRALAAVGVFHEDTARYFSLTPMGALLRSDHPGSVAPWAVQIGRPDYWQAWAQLLHGVQTGANPFESVHGQDVWSYRAARPQESAIFDAAMTALSRGIPEAAMAAYDFSSVATIADIGGGLGGLLGGILAANPHCRGVLFDQPHVVARAPELLARLGVLDRCEVVGGDFFQGVPAAELLLLKAVLHDWNDARCIDILQSCHRAMLPHGRMLVLERVIAPPNQGPSDKFSDLNMFTIPGGQERSAEEFEALFAAAGLQLARVIPTTTRMSLIEAVPTG